MKLCNDKCRFLTESRGCPVCRLNDETLMDHVDGSLRSDWCIRENKLAEAMCCNDVEYYHETLVSKMK